MPDRGVELIFTGDNRSAVKALEGIAKQSDETKDNIKGNSDEESLALDKTRKSAEMLRDSLVGLAGLVGIGGVALGMKDLAERGIGLETQQSQLATAIRGVGAAGGDAADKLDKYAESLSTKGGFDAITNSQALVAFIRETKSATEAQKLLALSTNIARGTGNTNLASVQNMVARAYTGQGRGLQALVGPMVAAREASVGLTVAHQKEIAQIQEQASLMNGPLKTAYVDNAEIADHITAQQAALAEMTDKHATAQEVLAAATHTFAGATTTYMKQTQGQMTDLDHQFTNMTESLGKSLLPAMNDLVKVGSVVVGVMAKNKMIVLGVSGALFGLGAAWATLKAAQLTAAAADEVWEAATKSAGFVLKALTPIIDASAASLRAWALNVAELPEMEGVATVKLVFAAIFSSIAGAATAAFGAMKAAAASTFEFIMDNPWMLAMAAGIAVVVLIVTHFRQFKDVVSDVFHGIVIVINDVWDWVKNATSNTVHFIERIFATVFNAITFPFRKAFDFIKGGFHDIEKVIGGIGHFISHPFGFATGGVVPKYLASGGPSGTDTVPAWLTPGEGVVTTAGMQRIGGEAGLSQINSGAAGGLGAGTSVSISATPVVIKLSEQVLGRAFIHWVQNQEARGATSLVGGSIQMSGPGLPVGA